MPVAERKVNCWEFKSCGRGIGGNGGGKAARCAAALETRADGVNSGQNGGRACWAVAGTECAGGLRGTPAAEPDTCLGCLFYLVVMEEEHQKYMSTGDILERLR